MLFLHSLLATMAEHSHSCNSHASAWHARSRLPLHATPNSILLPPFTSLAHSLASSAITAPFSSVHPDPLLPELLLAWPQNTREGP